MVNKKDDVEHYPKDNFDELQKRKEKLNEKINKQNEQSLGGLIVGPCFIVVAIILHLFNMSNILVNIIFGFSLLFIILGIIIRPTKLDYTQLYQIQTELDLLRVGNTSPEYRAEQLFKYHQFELKKYYDQTLDHNGWIFFTGLIIIVLGFAFIGAALYLIVYFADKLDYAEKILIGGLGAVGTILSNFIGAIYLKIYSGTNQSLTDFHNRLVITHHLHFSNYLVSKIKTDELREKTLSELSNKIIYGENPIHFNK